MNPPPEALPDLLTRNEIAKKLGVQPRTITTLCNERGLPCVRLGARARFIEADVLAWLRRQPGAPAIRSRLLGMTEETQDP